MIYRLIHRNIRRSDVTIVNANLIKIMNSIRKLINALNKAMSIQVLFTVLELLLFGVIMVFIYTIKDETSKIDMTKIIGGVVYIHFIIFQVSFISDSTTREVKKNIIFSQKVI